MIAVNSSQCIVFSLSTMASVAAVLVLIFSSMEMWLAMAAMYESRPIRASHFIMKDQMEGLTSVLACSAHAGLRGYKVFRINPGTGACEMGDLAQDAEQGGNSNYLELLPRCPPTKKL